MPPSQLQLQLQAEVAGMHRVLGKVFGKQMEQETAVPSYLLHIKSIDIRQGEGASEWDKKDKTTGQSSISGSHASFALNFLQLVNEIYGKFARDRMGWRRG